MLQMNKKTENKTRQDKLRRGSPQTSTCSPVLKNNVYPALMGELCGVYHEDLGESWLRK